MPVLSAREAAVLDRLRFLCRHGDVVDASDFTVMRDPDSQHPCGGNITADKARRALRGLEAAGLAQSFDVRPRTYAPVASSDSVAPGA